MPSYMDGVHSRNTYWDVLGNTDSDVHSNQKESGLVFDYSAPYDLPPLHKNVVAQMQGNTTSTDEQFMPETVVDAEKTTDVYFPTGGYYRRQFHPKRSWGAQEEHFGYTAVYPRFAGTDQRASNFAVPTNHLMTMFFVAHQAASERGEAGWSARPKIVPISLQLWLRLQINK